MSISYSSNPGLMVDQFINLLNSSGLGLRRPVDNKECIRQMLKNANLTLVAMDGSQLVGVARSVTDFSYACYLSDLAVHKDYQRQGIGRKLIEKTRNALGENCNLILLSAPSARKYYPAIGFDQHTSAWILPPEKKLLL